MFSGKGFFLESTCCKAHGPQPSSSAEQRVVPARAQVCLYRITPGQECDPLCPSAPGISQLCKFLVCRLRNVPTCVLQGHGGAAVPRTETRSLNHLQQPEHTWCYVLLMVCTSYLEEVLDPRPSQDLCSDRSVSEQREGEPLIETKVIIPCS